MTAQDVNCYGGADGSASANATGGALPYAFAWSNGGAGNTINGLSAGTYTVILTDSNGCVVVDSVSIDSPSLLNCQTQLVAPVSFYQ